jgi:DNA topoisomerase-1
MEGLLDKIANGQSQWQPVIAEFYKSFEKDLENSYDLAEKVKLAEEEYGEPCPDCGGKLVIKTGRYGKFIACTNFPTCKYTKQFLEKIDVLCPTCRADIVIKKTRKGKMFYGCSNYPSCTFAAWKKEDIK